MNIENAKIAIDKMAAFLPDYILNDLYKDHNSTAHIISKDDNKVVFSVIFDDGEKRTLTVTVKRNVGADDVRLHRHEISVHYNGNMQVFSKLIKAEFYSDIVNVLFPVENNEPYEDEKTDEGMTNLLKKDSVPFLNVLHKLADKRFSFSIVHSFDSGVQGYSLEMSFMGDFVASCSIPEFHITTAVDCLIDLINYADKQNHSDYFDKFGVSFEIYHCKNLNGKNYYSFRKNEGYKWVKISDKVASYILAQNDIVINGLYDSVVSYCQYDCYYNINLKGE